MRWLFTTSGACEMPHHLRVAPPTHHGAAKRCWTAGFESGLATFGPLGLLGGERVENEARHQQAPSAKPKSRVICLSFIAGPTTVPPPTFPLIRAASAKRTAAVAPSLMRERQAAYSRHFTARARTPNECSIHGTTERRRTRQPLSAAKMSQRSTL